MKLSEFVVKNLQRTASDSKELKNVAGALENICELSPRELGHLLFVIASAERAHHTQVSPLGHFKRLISAMKDINFELKCAVSF